MADNIAEIEYTDEELKEINRIVSLVTGEEPEEPFMEDHEAAPQTVPVPTVEEPKENLPDINLESELETDSGEDNFSFSSNMDFFANDDPLPGLEDMDDLPIDEFPEDEFPIDELPEETEDTGIGEISTPEENQESELENISELISTEEDRENSEIENDDEEIERLSVDDLSIVEDDLEPGSESMEESHETEDSEPSSDFKIDTQSEEEIPDLDEISMVNPADIPEGDISDIPEINLPESSEENDEVIPGEEIGNIDINLDLDDETSSMDSGEEPRAAESPNQTQTVEEISPDSLETTEERSPLEEIDDFDEIDFDKIPDIDFTEEKPQSKSETPEETNQDFDSNLFSDETNESENFLDVDIDDSMLDDEPLVIEPLEDETTALEYPEAEDHESGAHREESSDLELTDNELGRLKKAIILFNPAIRDEIKDTVINDKISKADIKRLVDMILTGKPEDNIHKFLERRLKKRIELKDEGQIRGRRVITSKPEYTVEGRERQKRLLRMTKIFGITTLFTVMVTIISYNYIYKPWMAKKLINRGVSIIEKSGLSGSRFNRKKMYLEAEKLFKEVDREYEKDFIYGYNAYARAYLKNKDFKESLEKLNKAYKLEPTNKKVLNALGDFYARTSKTYFKLVRGNLQEWYFRNSKKPMTINSNLEMAINFYRRVLLQDKKNIDALVGIGDAYFYQGQYLKAKQYYENIIKVDSESIVGYSGLLNLYIERDSMPMTVSLHTVLREKNLLKDLPLPLLSKLAGYYIDKNKEPDRNVRIDYGITSPRFKDPKDKIYPAIHSVLKTLNKRDPDYPQLQIQYARLNQEKKNFLVMERYLKKALELSPHYYSALHLLGRYNYINKEPVKAYEYLKKAVEYYTNQPPFTKERFYKETENIGETYKYLGNIFYYYFDTVKDRKGALDDEIEANESDKLANMAIAKQYYLRAANLGNTTPELNYNLGRIHYLEKNYTAALDRWLQLYGDFIKSPELMLSLGDAFYHKGSYGAAKGEYLKLISVMEYEADKIRTPRANRKNHLRVFQTLSSTYNNLGAVYQNLDEAEKRDLAYWKSIEFAKKIGRENEYARINLARSHRDAEPLLDESIPYSIEYYTEKMRQ